MRRIRGLLPIILVVIAVCAGMYLWHGSRPTAEPVLSGPVMRVVFLEAALGGGTVVRTPEGEVGLIDPGPAYAAPRLVDYLESEGVRELTILATNSLPSRAGAVKALIESFQIKRIVRGEIEPSDGEVTKAIQDARSQGIPELVMYAGDGVGLSQSVRLEVLGPPKGLLPDIERRSMSNSMVARLEYGGKKILFASDAGIEAEGWLIHSGADLRSDVLVVGQRGGSGATSAELISFVRPRIFVVSTGGRLGRPSRSVLNRISPEFTGAAVYRTDRDGTIRIVTDGRTIAVETERGRRE